MESDRKQYENNIKTEIRDHQNLIKSIIAKLEKFKGTSFSNLNKGSYYITKDDE